MPIRVVVAEDAFLVREAVTRVLKESPEFELVGTAATSSLRTWW